MASRQNSINMPAYTIYREGAPGQPFDPSAPLQFFPPKDSDELFFALRNAFPHVSTHTERMRTAVIEFLVSEGEMMHAGSVRSSPLAANSASTSPYLSMTDSNSTTSASPPAQSFNSPATVASSAVTGDSQTAATPATPALERMTSVFSLSSHSQPKVRSRRKMTEAEKVEYRKRRTAGACSLCKDRKRKCKHNDAPSAESSSSNRVTKPMSQKARGKLPQRHSFDDVPPPVSSVADLSIEQPVEASSMTDISQADLLELFALDHIPITREIDALQPVYAESASFSLQPAAEEHYDYSAAFLNDGDFELFPSATDSYFDQSQALSASHIPDADMLARWSMESAASDSQLSAHASSSESSPLHTQFDHLLGFTASAGPQVQQQSPDLLTADGLDTDGDRSAVMSQALLQASIGQAGMYGSRDSSFGSAHAHTSVVQPTELPVTPTIGSQLAIGTQLGGSIQTASSSGKLRRRQDPQDPQVQSSQDSGQTVRRQDPQDPQPATLRSSGKALRRQDPQDPQLAPSSVATGLPQRQQPAAGHGLARAEAHSPTPQGFSSVLAVPRAHTDAQAQPEDTLLRGANSSSEAVPSLSYSPNAHGGRAGYHHNAELSWMGPQGTHGAASSSATYEASASLSADKSKPHYAPDPGMAYPAAATAEHLATQWLQAVGQLQLTVLSALCEASQKKCTLKTQERRKSRLDVAFSAAPMVACRA